MTLGEFIRATAHRSPDTELLILDLCGLVSPLVILDPSELADGDPVLDLLTPNSLILTSDPV